MSGIAVSWRRTAAKIVGAALIAIALAGCADQTSVDQPGNVNGFTVDFSIDPQMLRPPQNATLSYAISTANNGKPVTQFDAVAGAQIHNVLISRDLAVFHHSYSSAPLLDQFSMPTLFPQNGKYYSYTFFKPKGSDLQMLTGSFQAGDEGSAPQLTPDGDRPRDAYGTHFELLNGTAPLQAGKPAQLVLYVTERGKPVTELWPFLDAPGYLFVVDQNGANFGFETGAAEGHPMVGATGSQPAAAPTYEPGLQSAIASRTAQPIPTLLPVQQTAQTSVLESPGAVTPNIGYGPVLAFTHVFPKAGLYKVWAEVQYRAQIMQVGWVLNVAP